LIDTLLQDPGISVAMDAPPIVSPESPPTPAIMGKIAAVEHSMWPGVPLVPTMATGFSDDRQTRNARIPSYDVSGVWIDVDENRAHGRDERIGVQAFDESVEFTYRLIKAMGASASAPPRGSAWSSPRHRATLAAAVMSIASGRRQIMSVGCLLRPLGPLGATANVPPDPNY
jgi:hypothetical protein